MKFGIEFVFGIWLCLSFPQIEAALNITGTGNILFEIEILLFDNPTGTVFRNNDVNNNRETCDLVLLDPIIAIHFSDFVSDGKTEVPRLVVMDYTLIRSPRGTATRIGY